MHPFAGTEPLVGEVVGLRTFRVDESGLLLPLYSNLAWYDGPNTATCAPPTGERPTAAHPVPDPDCECGFYAYGSVGAATHSRRSRYVQAVVSCWGGVIAGTQGVRAEHARIDAIWLHPNVPYWMRRRVASRYPSARVYADRAVLLAEHPLSSLPCYTDAPSRHALVRTGIVIGVSSLLALGLLPGPTLRGSGALWSAWLAVTAALGAIVLWLLLGSHLRGHRAAAFIIAGMLAWMLAPLFGLAGWVLRVPVLRGLVVAVGGFLLSLRPGYFPIEHGARERAFCGVRA
ncbi:MAG: hypothetical protein QOG80_225 [Pseudonocardiales bacterium]|jgi:hypothetical protein|nr:hypothetical protein [Pseudonocardiales bacterium]